MIKSFPQQQLILHHLFYIAMNYTYFFILFYFYCNFYFYSLSLFIFFLIILFNNLFGRLLMIKSFPQQQLILHHLFYIAMNYTYFFILLYFQCNYYVYSLSLTIVLLFRLACRL